ncbi:MmcQ/YjbR family DNA-binding protein [Aquamicrobium defluvii]|uniref:MmcQ/YjbR family DNA-binding protein n=1 Tax=Aquamicrobium defluvii TaxID=69279 RepID=A0A011TBY5_9HYPH|nr:MmcQ/YjbR family DNA-binding protein [Aquamicrobium defluvii]EXL01377.1 hypothetical protein BG36_19270 [Aquamicrobium defluvii]EZQ12694.1 hypothetical protein CF98_34930 [Halopseudomonas bauzanensis]TDR30883.1 hypothetical protein DES43_13934 [Aquamicrobium defluvii]
MTMLKWKDVVALAKEFPGVTEEASHDMPALRVKGRLLIWLRSEEGGLVLPEVPPDERDMLIEANPAVFYTTPHYASYSIVLARLAMIEPDPLRGFIERRWRKLAGKRAVAAFEARHDATAHGRSL